MIELTAIATRVAIGNALNGKDYRVFDDKKEKENKKKKKKTKSVEEQKVELNEILNMFS